LAGGVLNFGRYAGSMTRRDGKSTIQFSRVLSVRTEASTRNSPVVPLTELSDDDDGTRRSEQVPVNV
jgi:hypothetical protein